MSDQLQNYYDILDVKPDASPSEIRQAYLRSKAAYGKGSAALYSLFDEQESKRILEQIEQAYLVLSNSEKRKEYDKLHGFLQRQNNLDLNGSTFSFGTGRVSYSGNTALQASELPPFMSEEDLEGPGLFEDAEQAPQETLSEPLPAAAVREAPKPKEDIFSSPTSMPVSEAPIRSTKHEAPIVRRIDIGKPYKIDPEFEQEISSEITFRGEFLKKVREYKSVTIEELSDFTKISRTYLQCIEAEAFESLPAPVYLRGFIVQIAKALKLPHEKVATGYMSYYKNTYLK